MSFNKELGEKLKSLIEEEINRRVKLAIREDKKIEDEIPVNADAYFEDNVLITLEGVIQEAYKRNKESIDTDYYDEKIRKYVANQHKTIIDNAINTDKNNSDQERVIKTDIRITDLFILIELYRRLEECLKKGKFDSLIDEKNPAECNVEKDRDILDDFINRASEQHLKEEELIEYVRNHKGRKFNLNSVLYINIRKELARRATKFWELESSQKHYQEYMANVTEETKDIEYNKLLEKMVGEFAIPDDEHTIKEQCEKLKKMCIDSVHELTTTSEESCEILDISELTNQLRVTPTIVLLEAFMRCRIPKPTIDKDKIIKEIINKDQVLKEVEYKEVEDTKIETANGTDEGEKIAYSEKRQKKLRHNFGSRRNKYAKNRWRGRRIDIEKIRMVGEKTATEKDREEETVEEVYEVVKEKTPEEIEIEAQEEIKRIKEAAELATSSIKGTKKTRAQIMDTNRRCDTPLAKRIAQQYLENGLRAYERKQEKIRKKEDGRKVEYPDID